MTWGRFPNNLIKVMGHHPQLTATEVKYANSFIFDIDVFQNGTQRAGFLDRPFKELLISRTSLYNRCRYSVTHHSFIGMTVFRERNREAEGHRKLLHLHEHEKYREVYTGRENVALDYAVKVARDPHEVSDDEFDELKWVLGQYNRGRAPAAEMTDFDHTFIEKWKNYRDEQHKRLVDAQLVELTWLVAHFCLLNRWFTVLQVPAETVGDEANFLETYEREIPEDIRQRNDTLLRGEF